MWRSLAISGCAGAAALGHGQRAVPEDVFKPAEQQGSGHGAPTNGGANTALGSELQESPLAFAGACPV